MIPSQKWFPTSLAERAAWYLNFKNQFAIVAASLGLDDYTKAVGDDNQVFQFLAGIDNQVSAFENAVRAFRKLITEGDVGDPTPAFPPMPAFAPPLEIPTGVFERLVKLREKIMAADDYTDETGALLGILPSRSDSIAPSEAKPSIHVMSAETGYLFSVVVSNRGESDMWDVLVLRKGASAWQTVKTATGKSVDVVLPPSVPGETEQVQARVQLKKNNQKYGQASDIVYVTVNP
jgi:hypothetical protein